VTLLKNPPPVLQFKPLDIVSALPSEWVVTTVMEPIH